MARKFRIGGFEVDNSIKKDTVKITESCIQIEDKEHQVLDNNKCQIEFDVMFSVSAPKEFIDAAKTIDILKSKTVTRTKT